MSSATIGIVVHAKNEDEVVKFATTNKPLLASAKVLVTRTEKNKIESVLDKKNLTSLTSLELKGDANIASKASRGELAAVLYFSPPNDAAAGLIEIASACSKKKTYLALNPETADCILARLASEKILVPVAPSTLVRKESKVLKGASSANLVVATPGPLAILEPKPITPARERRSEWSNQQLMFWLEQNELEALKDVFNGAMTDTAVTKIWSRHETRNNVLSVKSGNLQELVKLLVLPEESALSDVFDHDEFVRDWFMTFHSFVTPKEFLKQLRDRFDAIYEESDGEDAESQAEALAQILMTWLSIENAADFAQDEELFKICSKFIDGKIKEKLPERASMLKKALETNTELFKNPPESDIKNAPAPIIPKRRDGAGFLSDISEVDPLEIARQMTLMESTAYHRIRANEFQRTAWTRKNANVIAPNLSKVIQMSNHFSNWIITELLRQKTYEQMAELIIKFVKVGKHMLALNNFSGVLEVVTALSNSAIGKLKTPWSLIPAKTKETFEELSDLVTPLGHYKKYREAFRNRDPAQPCLPILAATLSDLNGYEEVFSNTTKDGFINWTKMNKISGRIFENVSLCVTYELKPVNMIQHYIRDYTVWTDNLTTCAIADLRNREISKQAEVKEKEKRSSSKRRSSSSGSFSDLEVGPRDEITDRDWQLLCTGGTQPLKTFKKDQVVLAAGAVNDSLFRIKKGTVRVIKEINGELINVGTMGENAMFGEVSMLLRSQKEGTATASIIADEDVEIWVLDIESVMQLLEGKPTLAEKLHRILAIKLARRLRDLGKKPSGPTTPASASDSKAVSSAIASANAPKKEEEKPKKSSDPNERFNRKFGLEGEAVFREMECSVKIDNKTSHGKLFVSQNYLCFDGGVFGLKQREIIALSQITDMKKKTKYIMIIREGIDGAPPTEFAFGQFDDRDEAYNFISSIWKHQQTAPKKDIKKPAKGTTVSAPPEGEDGESATGTTSWLPSQTDWDLILKGARIVNYKKDDPVIVEDESINRVYQLIRGECRFEKMIDGQNRVLGKMGKEGNSDALFGEISFLEGGKASASVVVDKDDTQVAIIEGYWLDVLFQYYPELSGRFYHYLAHVLSKRLKQRESAMLQPSASAPASSTSSGSLLTSSSEDNLKDKKKKKRKHDKAESKKEKRKSEKSNGSDEETEESAPTE